MGGLAFKTKYNIQTDRLSAAKYFEVSKILENKLKDIFNLVELIPAYQNKPDFGDADFLVSEQRVIGSTIREQLQNLFNLDPEKIIKNDTTYSCLIDNFQVNVIVMDIDIFQSTLDYFSYSPSGNLGGKLMHKFGAKLGHDGMSYMLRDSNNTYQIGSVPISKNYEKICNFLDLDFSKRNHSNFKVEEDIFEWIIQSKYFDHRIFSFENMNHIARVRDRKRPDYNRFMSYISKYSNKTYDFPLKSDSLEYINKYFPEANLIGQITDLKNQEYKRQLCTVKFNGNLVRDWTKVEGKELGGLLRGFKDSYLIFSNYKCFNDYLTYTSDTEIKQDFMEWFNSHPVKAANP